MKRCTALLGLFSLSLVSAISQHNDATDTAPGVAAAPAPAPALVATPPPAAAGGQNLLPNGDFQTDSRGAGFPDGWNPQPGLSWEQEAGRHFMRLTQQQPGKHLMLYREVRVPEGTKAVEIAFQYRVAGIQKGAQSWFDARAIFHCLDANRQPVKPEPTAMIFNSKEWTQVSQRFAVPDGAAILVLMPSLFQVAAGTLDLAEVRVTPLSGAEASAMAAAAAAEEQKKAERAATLAAEEALPAKTAMLHVSGNRLQTAGGQDVQLQGVNVESLEWNPAGEHVLWTAHVAFHDWNANVIRLPVANSFWFGKGRAPILQNDAEAYCKLIDDVVKLAAANGGYVILDLHRFLAPDDDCVAFWKEAAARYKDNPAVIFDIFNEPHDIPWEVWRNGGMVPLKDKEPYHSPGMQALVDAVRGTGAKNIIAAAGLEYAFNLSGVLNGFALDDKGGNGIMYSTHFYNWHKGWEEHFLKVAEQYPVLVGEFGAAIDPKKMSFIPANQQESPTTWMPDAIGLMQKYHLNWTAFCLHPHSGPPLISDWDYTPIPTVGDVVKDALHGKQFTLTHPR